MKPFKIYTVGKMSGTTFEEQIGWRNELQAKLYDRCMEDLFEIIKPPLYYNYEENAHKSEREVKDWELHQVRDSDIVVVNLKDINDSVGAHFEIATAEAVNHSATNKHIFILGYGKETDDLHPWIKESLFRTEENMDDLIEYISNYLMI